MTIKYITELDSIYNFNAWSGGKDILDLVIKAGKVKQLDNLLEELQDCDNKPWTETQINDFLWFDLTDGNYDGFTYEELTEKANKNQQ